MARPLLLLACGLAAACGPAAGASAMPGSVPTASPFTSPAGGPPIVAGTVTAGPVCPVEKSPPDPQCAPRPVAGAVIVATDLAGDEVGRAVSGADGSYELVVTEGGTVLVTGQPVDGLMGAPTPVTLTLTFPSEHERIDLQYDTGIR